MVINDLNLNGMLSSRCITRTHHDRSINAAINVQWFATNAFAAVTALPGASLAATLGTAASVKPAGGGKVTPVRHEHGQ